MNQLLAYMKIGLAMILPARLLHWYYDNAERVNLIAGWSFLVLCFVGLLVLSGIGWYQCYENGVCLSETYVPY